MSGTLYGLGVGPGDPELLTLKAARILGRVPVIAYMAPEDGESMARAIAAAHLDSEKIEIAVRVPMVPGRAPARSIYDRYVAEIETHLEAGRDVAFLCQGDPFFFGSFMYVFEALAQRRPVAVVPGVSSLGAAAAAAGMPLASRNEVLTVLPAPLSEEELEDRLGRADIAVILKVGRHMAKVRRVLERLGKAGDARYVEHASTAGERVLGLDEVGDEAPYFSLILVPKGGGKGR